jgi:uncharacterized protein YkwD
MLHLPVASAAHTATRRVASVALLAGLLTLGGCGGGSGDASAAPTAPATPATPASSASQPTPTAGTRITCNLPNFEADMLAAVNARRRAGASCGSHGNFPPAPDLAWNAALTQAAVAHSDDMVSHNFFDHTGSDGSTPGDRETRAGYTWRGWGENIAAGQSSVAEVVDGWMKSEGHCANLMNAAYKDIGVACVAGNAGTTYRTYWTQDFGTPR